MVRAVGSLVLELELGFWVLGCDVVGFCQIELDETTTSETPFLDELPPDQADVTPRFIHEIEPRETPSYRYFSRHRYA